MSSHSDPQQSEHKHKKQHLVIVGAGMAAHAFVRSLVQANGLQQYDVTIIGEEPQTCYDRVNLTECFSGKTPEDLLLSPIDWYVEHGIAVLTSTRIARIDRQMSVIVTDQGQEIPYQQLVLATGSHPFVPPIEGVDLPGVFVYRTIQDIEDIKSYAAGKKTAAVLGGGLLGLEAAKALHDMGLETHVAEVAGGLMPRQLNAEAATLLKDEVQELGVTVHLLRRAENIQTTDSDLKLAFQGHDPLSIDMVVISAGIRPNNLLAVEADLECCPRGGIVVDSMLRTNDPKIRAIGECASYEGTIYGLVGPCYEMAEIAAESLVAQSLGTAYKKSFQGGSTAARLKLMGVDVSTLGLAIGEAAGATPYVSQGDGYCRTLLIEKRRLVGAIGVGPWPERELLGDAITKRRRFSDRELIRFKESGLVWPNAQEVSVAQWPATATVCSCLGISRGELTTAYQSGAKDAESLAEATGASTVCGSCRNLLCELAGEQGSVVQVKGRRKLVAASGTALGVLIALFVMGPVEMAHTVQSSWRQIDWLWRESFARQITGFSLLAITLLALTLSLRKRITWFNLGDFGSWRGIHGILGTVTVLGFLVHTGMRMGHNFTLALAVTFILLNIVGAFTGITAAMEASATGASARWVRAWRPRITQLHIWFFWPLPVLILFHIISVYYY